MNKMIAVLGPTAVGKTKVSIDLAKRLNTEIISGDSMLLYRHMDIGTAKPDTAEQSGIFHHLLNILEPHEDFSVVDFKEQATAVIDSLNQQGKIPILAGGTGLYVKALLEGYHFNPTPSDADLRRRLEETAARHGNEYLHRMLSNAQPAVAARLHPNDLRRVIRALEVHYLSGETVSQEKQQETSHHLLYDAAVIGLTMDRACLYERINQRVDLMVQQGLEQEVQKLLNAGITPGCQAMQGIGYKEMVRYLEGQISLPEAIDAIKQATRHFAKRQLTWYRKMPYITWFDVNCFSSSEDLLEEIYKEIAGKFKL